MAVNSMFGSKKYVSKEKNLTTKVKV